MREKIKFVLLLMTMMIAISNSYELREDIFGDDVGGAQNVGMDDTGGKDESDEKDESFIVRKIEKIHLACHAINASAASNFHAERALDAYVMRSNSQHAQLEPMKPTEKIVNDQFEGKLCIRLMHRDKPYPKPRPKLHITLSYLHSRTLYVKRYEEVIEPKIVERRVLEFEKILEKNNVKDIDIKTQYILTYLPDLYEIGFEKLGH